MKHLDSINELFGSNEGDDFTSRLLDIVEKEKVKIIKCPNRYGYIFEVDGVHYEVEAHYDILNSKFYLKYYENNPVDTHSVRISRKIYNRAERIHKDYDKMVRISNLPDISEEGRAAKKYNL